MIRYITDKLKFSSDEFDKVYIKIEQHEGLFLKKKKQIIIWKKIFYGKTCRPFIFCWEIGYKKILHCIFETSFTMK